MPVPTGYTTAELLALRPSPPPPRARPDLHAYHRAALSATHNSTFAFAHYPPNPTSLLTASSPHAAPTPSPPPPPSLFRRGTRLARWLRYGRSVACFNLYPATPRDLRVNRLLWQVARAGEYDPAHGNPLLETNVFSLAMPHAFFHFLRAVSEPELHACMLHVLALIAEDEDPQGLALMKSELEPSVWRDLRRYMAARPPPAARPHPTSPAALKLMRDVEMLLRLCYLSPWKIDVYASYVSPQDMAAALADAAHPACGPPRPDILLLPDPADRTLVRSAARRPVSSQPQAGGPPPRGRTAVKTAMFWKLFLDWRRHRKVLVDGLRLHPADVARVMMHAIAAGKHHEAWERAEIVMACATRPGNLFAALPREVVYNLVAPHVLLAGCKS